MEEDSIQKQLQFFFPQPSREDWQKIAVQETNGKDPFEALAWRGRDNIIFLPYYDAVQVAPFRRRDDNVPAAKADPADRWLNIPAIAVSDGSDAHKVAIQQISHGADGVFFYLTRPASGQAAELINGIEHSTTNIFFRIYDDQHFKEVFDENTAHTLQQINGGLFWESIPKTSSLSGLFNRRGNFRALGLIISGASPTEEIATALVDGARAYERFGVTSSPEDVLRSICFSIAADASFLECVSKIKALRRLWTLVARSYGHNDYKPEYLHIHTRSLATPDEKYAPRENMLKATFASMAAVAGGCDSLTIEGDNTALFQRWATNVSHILKHESFFDRTTDPLAGAFAVEAMTDAIAHKAWELFQSKIGTA